MELGLQTVEKGDGKDRVQQGLESEEDRKLMKKLVWKFDLILLPVLTILCEYFLLCVQINQVGGLTSAFKKVEDCPTDFSRMSY